MIKMNDKDFDKLLGDRLREERRFNDDEEDWQALATRLDAVSGGDSVAAAGGFYNFRRWILPLAALLLLATSGLLWAKLTRLDSSNTALFQQVQTLKPQIITVHDTVFINRTDTVFIERNPSQNAFRNAKSIGFNTTKNANSNINSNASRNANLIENAPINTNYSGTEKQLSDKIKELESKLQTSENQRLVSNEQLKIAEEKLNQLTVKTPLNNASNTAELISKLTAQKDSLHTIAAIKSDSIQLLTQKIAANSAALNPKINETGPLSIATKNTIKTSKKPTTARLFAGVSGGLINYKSTWNNQQGLAISRNVQSYQAGVKLEYALTDRLRLTAGGDYCPFNFEIFWQDSRYNLPTPAHFYPQTERIRSSKAQQKLAQVTFGSKYLFTDGTNRWRPYVGAGYSAMRILPFEAEYTIQNIANPSITRTVTATSSKVDIANLLLLNGGLEYRFSRRFVAQGEAFYNLDVNRPKKTYDLFGVRGAFLFNF
jgi:hypothetical protein